MTYAQLYSALQTTSVNVFGQGRQIAFGRLEDNSLATIDGLQNQFHVIYVNANVDPLNSDAIHNLIMFFIQQDTPDSTPTSRQSVIGIEWNNAVSFFERLIRDYDIVVSNLSIEEAQRQFAGTFTGVQCAVTLSGKLPC